MRGGGLGRIHERLNPRQHEQTSRDEWGWLGDGVFGFTQSLRSFELGGNGHTDFFRGGGGGGATVGRRIR